MGAGRELAKGLMRKALAAMPAPVRTPLEQRYLAHPTNEEARRVLAFIPTLRLMPLEDGLQEALPLAIAGLEEVALDCMREGEFGEQRRAQVREWVDALRQAVR